MITSGLPTRTKPPRGGRFAYLGTCYRARSQTRRHTNQLQALPPVALSTMRNGDDHHPQAFVDRDIDDVCQFRLIVEQQHSPGLTTRIQHVFSPVCSRQPQSLYATRNRNQKCLSVADLS